MREVDLAIVGAGPAGLFGAYYAGFRGLSTAVIDALPEPGGQVTAMYPEKMIFDVAGFPGIRGRDLVANLVEQAAQFHPQYLLGVRADQLAYDGDRPVLTLSDGTVLRCGAVLITGGLGSFTARPLPAAEGFTGTGLVFFVPHLADLAGHDVVIVGGGDSAFDWALALQPVARSVTLVHRREKFRAHASTVARVQALPIEIIVNAARKKKEEEASRSNTRSAGPPAYPAPASCAVYSGNRNIGCTELLAAGFGLDQMPCLDKLWTRESGWNPNAHNKSSGAHGIPQALPGSKMASYGANWETDARTQIKWGLNGYIKPRYKTPCGAWGHSQSTGWY